VARSLLAICAVLLFLLAAAALLAVARLLAGQREGESAMLTARGATRWQLVGLAAAEAIPLCAGLGGRRRGSACCSPGWWRRDRAGTGSAWLAGLAAAVAVAAVIMLVPALTTVAPGTARARRGRQAAISGVTRAGADLALVVLAVLAGWQLRHYSAVSAGANGNFGIDPVVVVAPALALAGGTVLALRLLPAGGKAGDRLAARGRRLTAALASWQISRQPIRQGGAALLIVLAVATGTLALSQRQSWTRSDHDQAAFSTGADVRSTPASRCRRPRPPPWSGCPGCGTRCRSRFPAASDTASCSRSTRARPRTWRCCAPTSRRCPRPRCSGRSRHRAAGRASPCPATGPRCALTARLGPASLGLAPATVTVSVEDADGDVYQLDAGTAARRRPGPHPDRQPGRPGGPFGQRGRGFGERGRDSWQRVRGYPLRLTGQPGLHAARPGPRVGHLHRGQLVRRAGDEPAARHGAARPGRPSPRPPSWPASARPTAPPGPVGHARGDRQAPSGSALSRDVRTRATGRRLGGFAGRGPHPGGLAS
jgi:hypothetical protein